MKTPGFRKTVLAAGIIVLGMGFTGCVEYAAPLCSAENLEDIPGLDGHKVFSMLESDFNLKSQGVDVDHTSKGTYFKGAVQTCRLGSNMIMQEKTKVGTYRITAVNSSATGLGLSTLVVGIKELNQAGIQYAIVERDNQDTTQAWIQRLNLSSAVAAFSSQKGKSKVLIVDNSVADGRKFLEKSAVPMGLGIVLK
jgi:hypothetical protein